jgi:hypothetical protein
MNVRVMAIGQCFQGNGTVGKEMHEKAILFGYFK